MAMGLDRITPEQAALIRAARVFFVASADPALGAGPEPGLQRLAGLEPFSRVARVAPGLRPPPSPSRGANGPVCGNRS